MDFLRLKMVTCDPGKLAQFLKSDDMGAIYELSKALCSLDVSEISDLVKVIHENVDITGLLNKTETVANKTINYDSYRDELILRPIILNTDMFNPIAIEPKICFY